MRRRDEGEHPTVEFSDELVQERLDEQRRAAANAALQRIGPQAIEEMEQYHRYVAAGKPGNDYRVWLAAHEERDHE